VIRRALDDGAPPGESPAGRIAFVELAPFDITEVGAEQLDRLWVRGGFPDSFLAGSDTISPRWRRDFIRTYLERDIPQLGPADSSRDAAATVDDARAPSRRPAQRRAGSKIRLRPF
jgi:predicted AAA+ superfamily ATPase